MTIISRIRAIVSRRPVDAELDEELRAFLDASIEQKMRDGMSRDAATRAARMEIGSASVVKDRVRDLSWGSTIESVWQDIRFAVRMLRRSPGFAIAAVATLALGIGANTAIFSIVDGVLLRSSPFRELSRLTMVWGTDTRAGTSREPVSIPDYFDVVERATQFDRLAAFQSVEVNLTRDGVDPERLAGLAVTHEFGTILGVPPITGRALVAEDDQLSAPRVAIISEDLWGRLYARDPGAIGGTIRLNDIDRTIVGVMPRGADFGTLQVLSAAVYGRGFAERGERVTVDVWLPLRPDRATARRENHPIFMMGRLRQDATLVAAQREQTAIAADLEREYPQSNSARGAFVEPLESVVFDRVQASMYVLLGAVGLVLMVACVNVANLLLIRTTARRREVTVRLALGAGPGRLWRQFIVEGAVLALSGGVLGVLLAFWTLDVLVALAPSTLPRIDFVRVDARALVMTLIASMIVAVAFGVLPAVDARRRGLQGALRGAGRQVSSGASPVRSALIVGEFAMTIMLMVGAGLLIRSMWDLQQVDPGFSTSGVLKAEFQLPVSRYPQQLPDFPRQRAFFSDVTSRLRTLPGVESVALASSSPLSAGFTSSIAVAGRELEARDWPEPAIRTVSTSYFETLRVPLVAGRLLEASDTPQAPLVMLINEAARRAFFSDGEAIGRLGRIWGAQRAVVGVVGNERFRGIAEAPAPAVYLPLEQAPNAGTLLVRTTGDPASIAPSVRRVAREVDPLLPLFGVEPLTETLADSQGQRRFAMTLLLAFAAMALLLAVVGIHGVVGYSVAQRTQELGIRRALGAQTAQVVALVLRQSVALTIIGLALGLAGAAALTQFLDALLFGVTPLDAATFGGAALVFAAVALMASLLPARRAARVDPAITLRGD